MRNSRSFFCLLFCLIHCGISISQQQADLNKTIFLDASIDEANTTIELQWDSFPNTTSYHIFQKLPEDESWGLELTSLDPDALSYTPQNIDKGQRYEFRVLRLSPTGTTNGYLTVGLEAEQALFSKQLILVISPIVADALMAEIESYLDIVEKEGMYVQKIILEESDDVLSTKDKIVNAYLASSDLETSVFLLGNIPVAYSGNIGPDGHGNHIGAWPCDGFYGDIDGTWTDVSVNNTSGGQTRTHNIPGDGKFDQSTFPSPIDLAVGRADFSDLPLFELDEVALTRRYLEKNKEFRTNKIQVNRRGIVENNFGLAEGFGQNGYKNMSVLLGRDQVEPGDYSSLYTESYLWSYGSGGGNYQGASGVGNTTAFAADSLQTIFTMLFGSYFGDWDISNNFLRAALATGTTLSNAWAGRPNWYFHPMGMGADLGTCTKLTMNNFGNYDLGFGARQVHIALMGDPSLRMDYIDPLEEFELEDIGGHVQIAWNQNEIDPYDRYYIYRSSNGNRPKLVTSLGGDENMYVDSCLTYQSTYQYYLTGSKLHVGATGSYFIQSAYLEDSIMIDSDLSLTPDFQIVNQYNLTVELLNTSDHLGGELVWDFGDGMTSTEENPTHVYEEAGVYTVTLFLTNECGIYSVVQEISVETSSVYELENNIRVFPNPVSERLVIDISNGLFPFNVELSNSIDQSVYKGKIHQQTNQIDVSKLGSGMYILTLQDGHHKKSSFKVIIE